MDTQDNIFEHKRKIDKCDKKKKREKKNATRSKSKHKSTLNQN